MTSEAGMLLVTARLDRYIDGLLQMASESGRIGSGGTNTCRTFQIKFRQTPPTLSVQLAAQSVCLKQVIILCENTAFESTRFVRRNTQYTSESLTSSQVATVHLAWTYLTKS